MGDGSVGADLKMEEEKENPKRSDSKSDGIGENVGINLQCNKSFGALSFRMGGWRAGEQLIGSIIHFPR